MRGPEGSGFGGPSFGGPGGPSGFNGGGSGFSGEGPSFGGGPGLDGGPGFSGPAGGGPGFGPVSGLGAFGMRPRFGRFAGRWFIGRFGRVIVGGLVVYGIVRVIRKYRECQLKKKWAEESQNKVILHSCKRAPGLPSVAPFAIKIETFLRMMKINYVIEEKHPLGPKGKVPWITYKGQDYSDSQLIIEMLIKQQNQDPDADLTDEQKGLGLVMRVLLEEHVYWGIVHWRWVEDRGCSVSQLLGIPNIVRLILYHMKIGPKVKKQLYYQGMGRHSVEDIHHFSRKGLKALSSLLGEKAFLLGEEPHVDDCAVFALLGELLYGLPGCPMVTYVKEELPNLEAYTERMKQKFWPDWENPTNQII